MSKADKLKELRGLDRNEFVHGVRSDDLQDCPGCGENTCYYMGCSPHDIECVNERCKYYKKYTEEKRIYYSWEKDYKDTWDEEQKKKKEEDEDTKEIPLDDLDFTGFC